METKFYKCNICHKVITMVSPTNVPTICCGRPMEELKANTSDGAVEKHVPVVKTNGNFIEVTIGSVNHPMESKHYIQWIALETNQGLDIKQLNPNDQPKASFVLGDKQTIKNVYAYCNVHGLWKK